MKTILLFTLTLFLFGLRVVLSQGESIQFPTFADPPGPENVLVVYNVNSEMSTNIMLHYIDVRNIPFLTHKIGIDLKNPDEILDRLFVISLEDDELVLIDVEGDLKEVISRVIREKGMEISI